MSTTRVRRGSTTTLPVEKRTGLRPDIQGLRALAVIAVIVDHLFAWPSGGFVGVDVFFVISGFLITGLLLREHDRTGTISFRGFYLRRVKRIIPAAMLVIVATVLTAYLVFSSVRAGQTLWDGVWATLFAANWHSAIQGTDYFNAAFAASPLQHYWSLSVEEQFYFVWPWVMLLIFVIAGRARPGNGHHAAHRAITMAIVVITAASFGWGLYDTANNATWAYFSTFTRAWELGIGALLAVIGTTFARIPSAVRPVLGWIGLTGIIASLFIVNDDAGGFPAPWAALPVLATALVIAAGTGREQRWMWPVTNRVSSWIGDISYSLYLWHFPVIIILAALMPADLTYYAACIVLIVLLSVGSFYLVEEPIRRYKKGDLRAASRRSHGIGHVSGGQLVGVSVLAVAAIVLSAWALTPPRIPTDAGQVPGLVVSTPPASSGPTTPAEAATPAEQLQSEIRASLATDTWPTFDPPIDQLDKTASAPEWTTDSCLDVTPDKIERCTYGPADAPNTAVVLGDSVSVSWMPGVRAVLEPAGYRVQSLTLGQCPAATMDVSGRGKDESFTADCRTHNEWVQQVLAETKPALVIVSTAANTVERVLPEGTPNPENVLATALQQTLTAAKANGSRVVVLSPNPRGEGLIDCYTAIASPDNCVSDPPTQYILTTEAMRVASAAAGVEFVDTEDWFCAAGRCPAFVGSTPVTFDGTHLTAKYVQHLAPVLAPVLLAAPPA